MVNEKIRRPIIAGNWKMFKTHLKGVKLVQEINYGIDKDQDAEVVVIPPFTAIRSIKTVIEADKMKIKLGAQNMYYMSEGPFTGEISPVMLKALNVEYVIIGHSERRQYFDEIDELINKKLKKALDVNINPILCVGEPLKIRELGRQKQYVREQLNNCLKGLNKDYIQNIVIAYEPIWAIGTGKTSTPEDANFMISFIRQRISRLFSPIISEKIRIQYGGSVKPFNIVPIMVQPEIDGVLVGGASLNAQDFIDIVNYKKSLKKL